MTPILRVSTSLLLFTSWLALLFSGLAGSGGIAGIVHLLLAGSLVLFPWRALRS